MIDYRPHRVWIGLLILAIVIAAASGPLLGLAQQNAAQRLAAVKVEKEKASNDLRQLQDDIVEAKKLAAKMDVGETEKYLASADRLHAAKIIEHRAAEAHLTHFTYKLSPEQKTLIETVDGGQQELATSQLTFAGDAPADADAYLFFDGVMRTLPGRTTLRQFSLQRIGKVNAPVTDANLHVSARMDWLSNGAKQNLAESLK